MKPTEEQLAERRRALRERLRENFKKVVPVSPINSAILLPDGTVQPCHVIDWTLWRQEEGVTELCRIGFDTIGDTEVITSFCHMDLAHSFNIEFETSQYEKKLQGVSRTARDEMTEHLRQYDEAEAKRSPQYFETMIGSSTFARYETIVQAREGHKQAVESIRKS